MKIVVKSKINIIEILLLGFAPCRDQQQLRGMMLQENEEEKNKKDTERQFRKKVT